MWISIIIGLVAISVLAFAHELGHFIAAKSTGVKVEEFAIGFPPRIFSFKKGETRYALNLIPFGGYNKLAGEEDPKVPRSLASKSKGIRIFVMAAGSIMNLLLPLLLFSIAFMVPQNTISGKVTVQEVSPNSPAAQAGILPGDIILSIEGKAIENTGDLSRYIQLNLGKPITLTLQRGEAQQNVQVTPRWKPPQNQGAVGILTVTDNATIIRQHYPFWKAIPLGIVDCVETFIIFKNSIILLIIGVAPVAVAGPVGIAQVTGEIARAGISPLLEFAAFISISLGITQLLPLPALDGGRIAFVIVEWLRGGKRISPRVEGLIHLVGFFMLMALILAITYQDIVRIISGGSLLP